MGATAIAGVVSEKAGMASANAANVLFLIIIVLTLRLGCHSCLEGLQKIASFGIFINRRVFMNNAQLVIQKSQIATS